MSQEDGRDRWDIGRIGDSLRRMAAFCPQGMSARGLDLVHEVETDSSLQGLPTAKPLVLDTEPALKEVHVNRGSEPRKG